MFVPDVCVHCEAVGRVGGGGVLLRFKRSFCRSLKDGVSSQGSRLEPAALTRVAACHVTAVTHGDGGRGPDGHLVGTGSEPSSFGGDQ